MSEELKPQPVLATSARHKPSTTRAEQINQAKEKLATADSEGRNRNPIVLDDTYSGLREENRVVMRLSLIHILMCIRDRSLPLKTTP